jgi:hypothetical protein
MSDERGRIAMTDRERLRVAWNCWRIPAIVGVACTVFFIVTNYPLFAIIGLVCVPIGAVRFAVGLVMIGVATTGHIEESGRLD